MSHATLVNDGLFWFVIFLTLLMMMFIYAVIATLCVPKTSSTSCDQTIFADQATDTSAFSDVV